MKRYRMLLAAAVMLLLVLPVAEVAASPPLDATIELLIRIPPGGPDTFTATGPAVDAGLVCPSGDAVDISELIVGRQSGSHFNLHTVKGFTCADGSGTFILGFQAKLDFASFTATGNWNVREGTGDYEKLHGAGKMVATITGAGILDVFTGKMHVD